MEQNSTHGNDESVVETDQGKEGGGIRKDELDTGNLLRYQDTNGRNQLSSLYRVSCQSASDCEDGTSGKVRQRSLHLDWLLDDSASSSRDLLRIANCSCTIISW
jgi:hypothetical protein